MPALPGALEHIAAGRVPGGSRANLEFVAPMLRASGQEDRRRLLLAADAQTSGGLLLTVDAARAEGLCRELAARGQVAAVVGELLAASEALPVGTTIVEYG